MRDEDAAELRRLIPPLLELLRATAAGERGAGETNDEYGYLHREVRRILAVYGEECICPWPNIYGWVGWAAKQEDWYQALTKRAAKARVLCGLEEPPPWTLTDYERGGDPDDVPFFDEFEAGLESHKQAILEETLRRELAFRGPDAIDTWTKGHIWECSGKRGQRTKVLMLKVRQGSPFGEVVLRVFFITDSGNRLVLLHGYDKGADASDAREKREAGEACARRKEYVDRVARDAHA